MQAHTTTHARTHMHTHTHTHSRQRTSEWEQCPKMVIAVEPCHSIPHSLHVYDWWNTKWGNQSTIVFTRPGMQLNSCAPACSGWHGCHHIKVQNVVGERGVQTCSKKGCPTKEAIVTGWRWVSRGDGYKHADITCIVWIWAPQRWEGVL